MDGYWLMIRKADGWSIVLAGIWNRAIFTPDWISRVLFHEPEVETLLSILPHLPIVYRNSQVAIEVSTPRIVFRPRRLDDACIQAAEGMAHTVLNALRDTPLIAVGVNFAFVESTPRRDLVELFDFADNAALVEVGWDLQERRAVRRLQKGGDILNMTRVFDGQEIVIEFNFHTETSNNETARAAVNQRVIRLRDESIRLLKEVYRLQPVEGEDGHG